MINIELWKKRKKELNWSHDDLARESGVSRRTIAGIFAGDERGQNPTIETIQAIERALGLGLDDTAREEISVQEYRLLTASPFRHYRHSIKIFARNSGAAFMTFGRRLTRVV